jgi:hypothetical protein
MNDSNQNPLNDLAATLIRRGLPTDYSERAAAEIADHHRDLVDELRGHGMSQSSAETEATIRLGDLRTLAKKTVGEYQRRYWCARWPLITFLIAPIPVLIVAWYAAAIALWLVVAALTQLNLTGSSDIDTAISHVPLGVKYAFLASLFLVIPALVVYVFSRLAKRAALAPQLLFVAACILGVFVGMFHWERIGPGSRITMYDRQSMHELEQPQHADFTMVITLPITNQTSSEVFWRLMTNPGQLSQLLLPVVVAAAATLRARQLALQQSRLALGTC